jgi:hypothetical protein
VRDHAQSKFFCVAVACHGYVDAQDVVEMTHTSECGVPAQSKAFFVAVAVHAILGKFGCVTMLIKQPPAATRMLCCTCWSEPLN